MKPDVEAGKIFRKSSGFVASALGNHQAGAIQNAVAMGADDSGIDLRREAEIVAIDD
jgi:hypothetical protein